MINRIARSLTLLLACCAVSLLLFGCNYPSASATPDLLATAAAETVAARLTEAAAAIATTPSPAEPTSPGTTPAAPSPSAENTSTATSTSTPLVCRDHLRFVEDVTIPDGTYFASGESFTKTWRLKNDSNCTWTTAYALVFDSGNVMGGIAVVPLLSEVPPNASVDISVNLKAPQNNGSYRGNWMLRNDRGVLFGTGAAADKPFWVEINVGPTPTPTPKIVYDFSARYCEASWASEAGPLPCPGGTSDTSGFVVRLTNPKLEDGGKASGSVLETHPEWVNDGVISGLFPAFSVQSGDRFQATLGCLHGAAGCDVRFQLNYKADGGSLQNLWQGSESYDAKFTVLNLDLSSLAGKSVEFAFAVLANGPAAQDWALWISPRIVR